MSKFPYMSAKEVSNLLGLSKSTLYRIQKGLAPDMDDFPKPVKIGSRRIVYVTDEIMNFIEKRKAERL